MVVMVNFSAHHVLTRFSSPILSNIQRFCYSQLPPRPRSVLFFGTDDFATPSLNALVSAPSVVEHVEVVCPIPTGRRHGKHVELPVRKLAHAMGLRVHDFPVSQSPRGAEKFMGLDDLAADFDFGVAVSYGHLIPSNVISSFRCGTLNVHPSALPRFRGSAPLQHTILQGDKVASVSIIELSVDRFDHGKILRSAEIPVDDDCTYADLHSKLSILGAENLLHAVQHHDSLLPVAKSQNDMDAEPFFASKINSDMGKIQWKKWPMAQVHRVYRAIHHQVVVATSFQGQRIQLMSIAAMKVCLEATFSKLDESAFQPGSVFYDPSSKMLFVRCADKAWLGVKELRFVGKKTLSAEAFANGYGIRKKPAVFDDL
eukprot:m.362790 g.362790  ORF g.362790 m.362790 type:complete len:371 (-) comp20789_c0_seq3:620-1732(-)